MNGIELRDHGRGLQQHALGVLDIVASQFIGVDADCLSHLRRKCGKVPVAFDIGLICSSLQNARDIGKDLFPLLDAEIFDNFDPLFNLLSL